MTAPSKNWTNILDTQIDADSPIDVTLMTEIRDNLVNLKEWLGAGYTPAQNHNHDGVNSSGATVADNAITTPKLVSASVTLSKLKMYQGSWLGTVINAYGNLSVAVVMNAYGHTPVVGASNSPNIYWAFEGWQESAMPLGTNGVNSGALRVVGISLAGYATGHITWDYHIN